MTAEGACAELWGLLCPDAGPTDYTALVDKARRMMDQHNKLVDNLRLIALQADIDQLEEESRKS